MLNRGTVELLNRTSNTQNRIFHIGNRKKRRRHEGTKVIDKMAYIPFVPLNLTGSKSPCERAIGIDGCFPQKTLEFQDTSKVGRRNDTHPTTVPSMSTEGWLLKLTVTLSIGCQ